MGQPTNHKPQKTEFEVWRAIELDIWTPTEFMKWLVVSPDGQIIKSEPYGFTQSFGFIVRGIYINSYSHYMYITLTEIQKAQPFWNLRALIQEHEIKKTLTWISLGEFSFGLCLWFSAFSTGISKQIRLLWRLFRFSSFLSQHLRVKEVERHLWRFSPTRKDLQACSPFAF